MTSDIKPRVYRKGDIVVDTWGSVTMMRPPVRHGVGNRYRVLYLKPDGWYVGRLLEGEGTVGQTYNIDLQAQLGGRFRFKRESKGEGKELVKPHVPVPLEDWRFKARATVGHILEIEAPQWKTQAGDLAARFRVHGRDNEKS